MNTSKHIPHRWPAVMVLATFLALLTGPAAHAADARPPGKMTFQGFLTDASSPPVPLGNVSPVNKEIIFRIYDNAAGGTVKWAETQIVTLDKGHFSVLLGEGSSVSGQPHSSDLSGVFIGADASDRWLGITVDGTEITPRIQFFAAPYAHLAKAATSLVDSGGRSLFNLASGRLEGSADLVVGGSVTSLGSLAGLIFNERDAAGSWQWYATEGTARLWKAAVGDRLAITTDGHLGVGTSTPDHKLTVIGPANIAAFASSDDNCYIRLVDKSGFNNRVEFAARGNGRAAIWSGGDHLSVMRDGRVGIGTIAPIGGLEVNAAAGANSWTYFRGNVNGVNPSGSFGTGLAVGWNRSGGQGETHMLYGTSAGGAPRLIFGSWNGSQIATAMVIRNQRIGVGTDDPQAPLEIAWGVHHTKTYGYLAPNGATGYAVNQVAPYSILTSHRIGASEFNAFSDVRIKKIVDRTDNVRDLEAIQKLRVTDYRMLDRVAEGEEVKKGFIAQEVEEVIPEAVTLIRRFVPDIYSLPTSIKYDEQRQTLAVTLAKAHELKTGDRVRIIIDDSHLDLTVSDVFSATEFAIGKIEKAPKQIFVFGKEVPDFRVLNLDRIFATGISAIQELSRQVEILKKSEARVAELEEKTSKLSQFAEKAARVDSLEREVAELRKLVAGLVEGPTGQRLEGTLAAAAHP